MNTERLISAAVFVFLIAAFFYDRTLGWRALGIAEVAFGFWVIRKRRVAYGWDGRPPSGHLSGPVALLIGALAIGLGGVFVLAPEVIDEILSNAQSGS